ncbi:hypothetical protein [Natrinema gelatinilyticum]|uniref:hypothetical protein n=1 Tax=Natrinema gelatinilyticum TaxID=2961571 RepID=UPI0020C524E1|nr:hypothetical protein [Natrinema gelatinilyticum]
MRLGVNILTAVLVVILVFVIVPGGLTAATPSHDSDAAAEETSNTKLGSIDILIENTHIEIGDAERTYEIESVSVHLDGVTIDFDGKTYEICRIDITIERIGVKV